MKLKDLPKIEFPREKLSKYGSVKLYDFELMAILLGSGIKGLNVLELSKKIIKLIKKIGLDKLTINDLLEVNGLGNAKAAQIFAMLELGRRLNSSGKVEILSDDDVWKLCADFRDSKKEHFVAFYLDTQNCLIERQIISIGTLDASLVHPREVFEPAVALHASSVIVVHNHPSGLLKPSENDLDVTRRLKEAGELMGIALEKHFLVTKQGMILIN